MDIATTTIDTAETSLKTINLVKDSKDEEYKKSMTTNSKSGAIYSTKTAEEVLDTVEIKKSFLSKQELKRYKSLRKRLKIAKQKINKT